MDTSDSQPYHFEVEYHQAPDLKNMDRLPDCDLAAISTKPPETERHPALLPILTVLAGLRIWGMTRRGVAP